MAPVLWDDWRWRELTEQGHTKLHVEGRDIENHMEFELEKMPAISTRNNLHLIVPCLLFFKGNTQTHSLFQFQQLLLKLFVFKAYNCLAPFYNVGLLSPLTVQSSLFTKAVRRS